jgi:hypothetical protein
VAQAGSWVRTASRREAESSPGTTPSPSACMAITSPQGSMTMLWPQVRRPFSCSPPWPMASTWHWFSTARARSSSSQWAWPVV